MPKISPEKYLLFDIEGTITSLSFVKDILFPYSEKNLPKYLEENHKRPEVKSLIKSICEEIGFDHGKTDSLKKIKDILSQWIREDKKHTALKTLQGMVWKEGYTNKAFKGHLYSDVPVYFKKWKLAGFHLGIFSSGSIQAQQLLLGHSIYGDMTIYIDHYFDTTIGSKKQIESYASISKIIHSKPENILFFSDSIEELTAAQNAGFKTVRTLRPEVPDLDSTHTQIKDFEKFDPLKEWSSFHVSDGITNRTN